MLKTPVNRQSIQDHKTRKNVHWIKSRYKFLSVHNGIRPGCLHGLKGTMGSGKSSLLKCIITETAAQAKVLLWLSEETVSEYQEMISYLDSDVLVNIRFIEERDIPPQIKNNQTALFEFFDQMIEESGAEITFIDNITTSRFYNPTHGLTGQQRSAEFLRDYTKETGHTIFYAAHSGSHVTDNFGRVSTPEDIRGSKDLPMVTEYFYIIQKFTLDDDQVNLLRNAKHRHHPDAAGWYALKWQHESYVGDVVCPFKVVNKMFKARDYLGKIERKGKKNADPTK